MYFKSEADFGFAMNISDIVIELVYVVIYTSMGLILQVTRVYCISFLHKDTLDKD